MDYLHQHVTTNIRQARSVLAAVNTQALTMDVINAWSAQNTSTFEQAQGVTNLLIPGNIRRLFRGHSSTTDTHVLDVLRQKVIALLDDVLRALDKTMPIPDQLIPAEIIAKVTSQKLATLLREFNDGAKATPNIAAIGYRTIISLVLKEKAKQIQPDSTLATKDDIAFRPDIELALKSPWMPEAEKKFLRAYIESDRISFDNVAHKAGDRELVEPISLETATKILNTLLRTTI